ncbi:DUF4258 domain-containing protein [Microgenomates group bacterium]|nr:DUF4258 domain-containing protein [Microgenomates group bacterium]
MQVIFTNHALERIRLRHLSESDIIATVTNPTKTFPSDKSGETKFLRTIKKRRYQVIAKWLSDQNSWLVVSAWVRGEEDPEPILWTILAAPFRLIWEIIKFAFRKEK